MTNITPIPYFGGKSRAAPLVWQAFAAVNSYIEPFCGSAAVLLARPRRLRFETVNDAEGSVVNFLRALQADPRGVAAWCDRPRSEIELVACGKWLLSLGLSARLRDDPGFYDIRAAGVWAWYMSCGIGAKVTGNPRQQPRIIRQGVLGDGRRARLLSDLQALQERLRDVRILCGDWKVCLGPANQQAAWHTDPIGVFLDPPYEGFEFYSEGKGSISAEVRAWAVEHGTDPAWHIVLCGYEGEHAMPEGWRAVPWKTVGRVSGKAREVLWVSPHCARVEPS